MRLKYVPWNRPRTSEAVGLSSGDRLGPTTKVGRTVTRSILFFLANSHAAFSARIFATAYQIYQSATKHFVREHVKATAQDESVA
jgi:hypothetical protein